MLVEVFRASEGSLSGKITRIGWVDVPTQDHKLPKRIVQPTGNGAASAYVETDPVVVTACLIGGYHYRPQGTRVVIHYDNPAFFAPVESAAEYRLLPPVLPPE